MTEDQRKHLYTGSVFAPYGYSISIAFVCFAILVCILLSRAMVDPWKEGCSLRNGARVGMWHVDDCGYPVDLARLTSLTLQIPPLGFASVGMTTN